MRLDPLTFAAIVYDLSAIWEISVTSWGRTAKRNRAVGGHPRSKHLTWLAADIALDTPGDAKLIIAHLAKRGLACIDEGDHLHIQVPRTVRTTAASSGSRRR
jgi:hypothetical protein